MFGPNTSCVPCARHHLRGVAGCLSLLVVVLGTATCTASVRTFVSLSAVCVFPRKSRLLQPHTGCLSVLLYVLEQLPLYYEFDNRTEVERIVEIIRHATGRDAAFYVGGLLSAGLVSALACLGVYLVKRWTVRRHYRRQMEHELEPVGSHARGRGEEEEEDPS